MNKIILSVAAMMLLSGAAMANEENTSVVKDEKSPEVIAQYKKQCAQWADENQFSGNERSAYLEDCMNDMPSIQPYGYDKGE